MSGEWSTSALRSEISQCLMKIKEGRACTPGDDIKYPRRTLPEEASAAGGLTDEWELRTIPSICTQPASAEVPEDPVGLLITATATADEYASDYLHNM